MGVVYEYFMFNGKSSRDFQVWISGSGTFKAPRRDVESVSIPGRNGDLHIDNGRYENIEITYPAFIVDDFGRNYDAFKAYMDAQRGYKILEDSYHPEHFRRARFSGGLDPQMTARNREGSFDISFDCDPRRFLKDGARPISATNGMILKNQTYYTAKPLIRAYGTGMLIINDATVQITAADGYTDINSEIEEAYKGNVNCNGNLVGGKFPLLVPGLNEVSFTGFSRVEITPNWWTV